MKISKTYLYKYRNDAHFQFHTDFKGLVEEFTPEALNIAHLFQEYLPLYVKVDEAFKKITKSSITARIHEADKARDDVWRGLAESNATALRHFNPQMREAARRLQIVFDTYGNIAKKSLNEQTSAVYNILQELEGQYAQDIAKIGLLQWVVELKACNITVSNLVRDRIDEASQKVDIVLKKARADLDAKFYEIAECINAQASLEAFGVAEGTGKFEAPIRKLNIIISKYLLLVAQSSKKGKKNKDAAEDTHNNTPTK